MILLDEKGRPKEIPKNGNNEYFSPGKETGLGKAARVGYGAASSGLSSLLGFIPDVYNTLAPVGEKISELISGPSPGESFLPSFLTPEPLEPVKLPRIPQGLTSRGIRENVFNPIGEYLFGKGAMTSENGPIENIINRASEIAPLALLGGASIPSALGISGLQATSGEVAKQLGAGEGGQLLAELAGGAILPAAYKTAISRSVPKTALSAEQALWQTTKDKASKIKNIPISGLNEKAGELLKRSRETLSSKDHNTILKTMNSVGRSFGPKETSANKLINATRKIGNTIPHIKAKEGKYLINEFRNEINSGLDKMINTHAESRA